MRQAAPVTPLISKLVRRLVHELAPEKVILFGSHASGEAGADSDIDLLLVVRTAAPFLDRLTRARTVVAGLHPGVPFDPIVLTPQELEERLAAGDQLIVGILNEGRVLYAA